MSEMANVKIELEIPTNTYEVLKMVSEKFDRTIEDIIIESIKEGLVADAESGFIDYLEPFKKEILKRLNRP